MALIGEHDLGQATTAMGRCLFHLQRDLLIETWRDQLPTKQWVDGSNPSGGVSHNNGSWRKLGAVFILRAQTGAQNVGLSINGGSCRRSGSWLRINSAKSKPNAGDLKKRFDWFAFFACPVVSA